MAARKLNILIFFTIAGSCLSIIILGVCLGTNNWYKAVARPRTNGTIQLTINYGLFGGTRSKSVNLGGGYRVFTDDLKMVSSVGDNILMYSCGVSGDERKRDLDMWIHPNSTDDIDSLVHSNLFCPSEKIPQGERNERYGKAKGEITSAIKDRFLNFGLWLTTLLFMMAGMLFSAVSGGLALYNTFRAPSQPIFSVFGLYIWNGIAASCILMAVILWGAAFGSRLKNQAAVGETIGVDYEIDTSSLGYSYWLTILAECLCWANIGILRYRTWTIRKRETNLKVVDAKLTSPDHLLF